MKIRPRLYAKALSITLYESQSAVEREQVMTRFIGLLKSNRQMKELPRIIHLFTSFYSQLTRSSSAIITSSIELQPQQKTDILNFITSEYPQITFEPNFNLDPQLLGGFTVQVGDHFYDASIRNQLNQFLKEINL